MATPPSACPNTGLSVAITVDSHGRRDSGSGTMEVVGPPGSALSPQSEAVTNELQELTLQPAPNLPPLKERKNVLQLKLQQRRTREELVSQGIMPPLKSPAAFHEQRRSLERARTEDYLKRKIRSRPERSELVRMHILEETSAEPSLQAKQLQLKRARLADDLNDKISHRPGPIELVHKNILSVDCPLQHSLLDSPKGAGGESSSLDEDSSDALSPDQLTNHDSPLSAVTQLSPSDVLTQSRDAPPSQFFAQPPPPPPPLVNGSDSSPLRKITNGAGPTPASSRPSSGLKSQGKMGSDRPAQRPKKSKDSKPKVKKLKYHQYIPPDQKADKERPPQMDSSYAKLLHQQQLFLQLQILSQQTQQHYNYQTILPAPLKTVAEQASSPGTLPTSIVVSLPAAPPPPPPPLPSASARPNSRKPGVLPANLEEMKVAELKLELKLRGLPVSGTKMDLIERLKPFQDTFCVPASSAAAAAPPTSTLSSVPMEVTATAGPAIVFQAQPLAPESMSSTSPVSPAPTDPSVGVSEAASESKRGLQPLLPPAGHGEKDRRLHEKERQIEELMRKLEQEQRLVEELKMQLEVEKRGQVVCATEPPSVSPTLISTPPSAGPAVHNSVKMEGSLRANCSPNAAPIPSSVLGSQPLTGPLAAPLASVVKLEDVTVSSSNLQLPAQTQLVSHVQPGMNTSAQRRSPSQTSPQPAMPNLQQFFISHHGGVSQVLGQPQTLLTTAGQAGTQILLPVTLPSNAAAIQLPNASLQPVLQAAVSNPGLVQASVPQLQPTKVEMASGQPSLLQTLTVCGSPARSELSPQCFLRSSPDDRVSPQASPNHLLTNGPLAKPSSPQPAFLLQPSALAAPPKTREPPRYEEAIKQSRNNLHINNVSQVSMATSQHMDDLFDILIESGEIIPFMQQEHPAPLNKTHPAVTASVTTLPVNTVLSRPPPQIQMAPPPTLSSVNPSLPPLSSLATDNQLEAFLAGTPPASDPRTQGLMEELQAQLMEQQPYSPMDTSDLSFCGDSSPPSSFNMGLSDPALDNMEWLDLTMTPGPGGSLTPLGIPADFLDSHDLHWD